MTLIPNRVHHHDDDDDADDDDDDNDLFLIRAVSLSQKCCDHQADCRRLEAGCGNVNFAQLFI